MSYSDKIKLCFLDSTHLRTEEVITTLTNALMGDGFRLSLFETEYGWDIDPESHLWYAHLYNHKHPEYQALSPERRLQLEQPGMTPILVQALHDFTSSTIQQLSIQALGVSQDVVGLEFYFSLLSDIQETAAGGLHQIVTRSPEIETYWFERLPDLLYNVLHPDFEYTCHDSDTVLTSYHLQLGELPCLYGKNYFGPALVGKIGRERLLTTPGAEIRELGDGGIFLRDKAPGDAASEHLGLVWQSDAKLPDF